MYKRFFKKFKPKCLPTRVVICIMMFTCCWMNYMCRLQMSILAVPMIKTLEDKQLSHGACVSLENQKSRRSVFIDSEDSSEEFIKNVNYSRELLPRKINETEVTSPPNNYDNLNNSYTNTLLLDTRQSKRTGFHIFSNAAFEWTPFIRGQLISAYAWGNVPGNFIGGVLAQKFGPRRAVLWSSIIASLVSLATPILAQLSWIVLLLSRVIIGLTGGVTFPACHTLVAKWSPPNEKGRFVWTLQGGTFGSIFLFGIISGIAEKINWEMGWYLPALIMMVWIVFWWFLAFDSPEEHPSISEKEKLYIIESLSGTVNVEKPSFKNTPLLKILTSIPFICLVLCHFGNVFLLFFYQNGMMLYQTKALGFKLTKGGVVSGLPWASRVLFAFVFGWVGDTIKRKEILSVTALRKCATIFSHLLPGVCLIVVGYLGCSLVWANVFLILALGFNGAASISNLSNNQDLSPNYAGFLYGIMNTVGSLSGIMISPIVEEVAGKWGHPIEKWQILFWMGAVVCIVCMVIFIIGGSGQVQSWNEVRSSDPSRLATINTNRPEPTSTTKT
ncbi:putative inorganic phosphate cotransporter isoform X2 [Microplitis demolitor]|uniref:putative inorganic phosphate cotransporter isoform X2 n=1 Tax=Microplitis demolitor TaxID=69319 RepID=UPI00235B63D9|nr:putative inorganic phosphate cotransporter isoform X2 [Microplitis demolitor]